MTICLFVCVFGVEVAHVLQERVAKFGHKNYENATKLKVTLTTSTLHTHTQTHIQTKSITCTAATPALSSSQKEVSAPFRIRT